VTESGYNNVNPLHAEVFFFILLISNKEGSVTWEGLNSAAELIYVLNLLVTQD
jgi:hypothetical protein